MLLQRVLTAVIGVPVLVGVLSFASSQFVALVLGLFAWVATYEAARLLIDRPSLESSFKWLPVVLGAASFMAIGGAAFLGARGHVALALLLPLALPIGLIAGGEVRERTLRSLGCAVALVYGMLPWVAMWELYDEGHGPWYIYWMLVVVWCGDTAAYFTGRAIGRRFIQRPFAPLLSPKKSWEGAVASVGVSALAGAVAADAFWIGLFHGVDGAVLGAMIGVLGVLGDLYESLLKRFAGVKDSGNLFPGHGGFLDRVDGLVFATPVLWAFIQLRT